MDITERLRSQDRKWDKAGDFPYTVGMACIGYEWIYVPLVNWMGIEPWSLTAYGLAAIGTGLAINLLQFALGEHPSTVHS